VLANQRMDGGRLADAGFMWQHPSLPQAMEWLTSAKDH